jgi:wyosine [tRNA(Phe)-imidazoG37] synthetase (radical SAM superfamily)
LGIDPIPAKTCNHSCVYCQLGRTRRLVNKRREFFEAGEIVRQAEQALDARPGVTIDWVTFVGSGETCLCSRLGWLLRELRRLTSLPLAVVTNGSLLHRPDVRRELAAADAVLPSLDAGAPELFRRVNRPHRDCSFEHHLAGLIEFRRAFTGRLWLEIMLIGGVNDSEEALRDVASAVGKIEPDEIHVNVPTRSPAEAWVCAPDRDGIERAVAILGDTARVIPPPVGDFDLALSRDVVEAVLGIIARHPMRQEEVERSLRRWAPSSVRKALEKLEASGRARVVERLGSRFWSAASADYPEVDRSAT